jgi:pimeloyl-ACP methyl ester carboxylesterase
MWVMSTTRSALSINDRSIQTADGTRIAYHVEGDGPALVLSNGLTTTTTFWKYLRPIWLPRYKVITWDLPGHGASSAAASRASATVEAQPEIIASVMRAAGVERAFQIGWSTGAQSVLEMYRQLPERCLGIAMLFGPAGRVLQTARLPLSGAHIESLLRATPALAFIPICRALAAGMDTSAGHALGRVLGLVGPATSAADLREMTRHISLVDPRTLQLLTLSSARHDARELLARLRVPLLIVAGDKDPFAPSELVGVPLHRLAPGSELVRLPEGTHTALLEEPVLIARAVQNFIDRASTGASRVNGR